MPGSMTTPGSCRTCVDARHDVVFLRLEKVGTQDENDIVARWLACMYPYRRFGCILANAAARLGANADRYSFIAADLHRLLLAGFAGAPR